MEYHHISSSLEIQTVHLRPGVILSPLVLERWLFSEHRGERGVVHGIELVWGGLLLSKRKEAHLIFQFQF